MWTTDSFEVFLLCFCCCSQFVVQGWKNPVVVVDDYFLHKTKNQCVCLCVCLGTQYVLVWKKVGLQRGKQRDYQTFNNVNTSYMITIAALLKYP